MSHLVNRYLALLFLLPLTTLSAREIHLAPNGSDSAEGTHEAPLATLKAARDLARKLRKGGAQKESMVILIHGGLYYLKEPLVLEPEDSGTADSPLIFRGEKGGTPILLGGQRLTGFKLGADGKTWEAQVPGGLNFEQLYVNGRRAVRARLPNSGFEKIVNITETQEEPLPAPGKPAKNAVLAVTVSDKVAALLGTLSEAEVQRAVINFYYKWDILRKSPGRYDSGTGTAFIKGGGLRPWNPLDRNTRFYIENVKAALDAPDEWFLDTAGVLSYLPPAGEKMEQAEVMAPTLEQFVIIRGAPGGNRVSNVLFENLSFQVSAYRLPPGGYDANQLTVATQAAAPIEAAIQIDFAKNIAFRGCEITHTGGAGIWFRQDCVNGLVEHCYIHELGASGVKIGACDGLPAPDEVTKNVFVNNNIVQSGGYVYPNAVGVISFQASDISITHNDIADFRYSGVSLGWTWGYKDNPSKRNSVKFNHIHHLGWGMLADMGGVYNLGPSEGTVISDNVIHHVDSSDYGGWGLYLDEGSSRILIENNLVYACDSAAFQLHYGEENIVRNNIFARNPRAQLQASKVDGRPALEFTNNLIYWDSGVLGVDKWQRINLVIDNNLYWFTSGPFKVQRVLWADWQSAGKDRHSIIADPGFVDPAHNDFRLQNDDVVKQIGFKPFDYSQAGVYGSDEWKATAKLSREIEGPFGR